MQAELTAILSKVVFSKNGAQVVLECHSASSMDAARQLSKMTDKVVAATFDDGEEELPFDEEADVTSLPTTVSAAAGVPAGSLGINHDTSEIVPFEETETPDDFGDGCPFIDVPVDDDDVDAEPIEEVD